MSVIHYLGTERHGDIIVFDDGNGHLTTINRFCFQDDRLVLRRVFRFRIDYVDCFPQEDGTLKPRLEFETVEGFGLYGEIDVHETMTVQDIGCPWVAVSGDTGGISARAFGIGRDGKTCATRHGNSRTGSISDAYYDDKGLMVAQSDSRYELFTYEWLLNRRTGGIISHWKRTPALAN